MFHELFLVCPDFFHIYLLPNICKINQMSDEDHCTYIYVLVYICIYTERPYMHCHIYVRFWVAGCLEPVGTTFRFVSSNTWTNESPEGAAGIICDNLLGRVGATTPPSFCTGTNLMVRVRDTQTDLPMVGNTTGNVLRLDRGQEEVNILCLNCIYLLFNFILVNRWSGGELFLKLLER